MVMSEGEILDSGRPVFHGYRPPPDPDDPFCPPLTVTISRETGSRGREVARRVADLLSWQLVNQETLEYITHNAGSDSGDGKHWSSAASMRDRYSGTLLAKFKSATAKNSSNFGKRQGNYPQLKS